MANPNVVKYAESLDPLSSTRWIGLVVHAKNPVQAEAAMAMLFEYLQVALPIGTFVADVLTMACGFITGWRIEGAKKKFPIPLAIIQLRDGRTIERSPDHMQRAVYDIDQHHHFPVFVNDRQHITREALALEYIHQNSADGYLVEQVIKDVGAWMNELYTKQAYVPLPESVSQLMQGIAAHPKAQEQPLQLLNEACEWLKQADQEYHQCFNRKPTR